MDKNLKHKGYIGSIEFSKENNIYFGKVAEIDDLVLYRGESIIELKKSFIEAVEEYIMDLDYWNDIKD